MPPKDRPDYIIDILKEGFPEEFTIKNDEDQCVYSTLDDEENDE